ncbi:outer membrane protein transport protein [Flavobacteriaceae bacterium F08102]|nr:outer membrane protein transport protein [Flavobacteriaceae bacterium F08102]
MKKFLFLLGGLLSSVYMNAQIIGYNDAGILFSNSENNGTSRFSSMSGAFGALGGDMSAGDVNPAGLAVFKNSEAAITLGTRKTTFVTDFYGTQNTLDNNPYFNLMQAGGVMVFDTGNDQYWTKFAVGFNFALDRDFENNFIIEGNSGISDFNVDPYLNNDNDPSNDIFYENVDNQYFRNITNGQNEKFTISLAAQQSENLYLGFSLIAHNIEYYQNALFEEFNNDGNGNLLDASLLQELSTYGDGIGLSLGLIAKPTPEIRLGASYQTPTWYRLTDEFLEDLEISVSNNNQLYVENNGVEVIDYNLSTPSKLTGSFAYIFGPMGLISVDYTYHNYTNIKLKPTTTFLEENQIFKEDLKNSGELRIGTEWRLGMVSLRGGYSYKENPYKDALDSDHVKGYSLGVGFKFKGNIKLDLAYENKQNTDIYRFTNAGNTAPAELDIDQNKFLATLSFRL